MDRMRAGSDRFELGEKVFSTLFPEGTGFLRGHRVGAEIGTLVAAEGPPTPGATSWSFPLDDPFGNERRLTLTAQVVGGRVTALSARLLSKDKLDLDSAWRLIKDHLDKNHGAAGKVVGQLLTFSWQHPGEVPSVTLASRFRNEQGENVLDVQTRLPDGAKLPSAGPRLGVQRTP